MSHIMNIILLLNTLSQHHLNSIVMIFYLTNHLLNISIVSNNLLLSSNQYIILNPYFDSLDLNLKTLVDPHHRFSKVISLWVWDQG